MAGNRTPEHGSLGLLCFDGRQFSDQNSTIQGSNSVERLGDFGPASIGAASIGAASIGAASIGAERKLGLLSLEVG